MAKNKIRQPRRSKPRSHPRTEGRGTRVSRRAGTKSLMARMAAKKNLRDLKEKRKKARQALLLEPAT